MNQKHIEIAERLYACRDAARFMLGDKYLDKMRELSQIVDAVANRDKCNSIVAGATVIKSGGLDGMQALMMMAAVAEMIEPSVSDKSA